MTKSVKSFVQTVSAVAVGAALAMAMGGAGAAVLYEQLPDQVIAYGANDVIPEQLADNFTLSAGARLTSITWWGVNASNASTGDDFLVRLLSNNSGPGTVLYSFSAAVVTKAPTASQVASAFDEYQYDFTLPTAVDLSADTYYLSVQNLSSDGDWYWETGGPRDDQLYFRGTDANTWNSYSDDLAFRLNGTQAIPEPGSMALLLLAGAALLLTRRQAVQLPRR